MIAKVKTFTTEDGFKVSYSDASMRLIFDEIVKLCKNTDCFSGEVAAQSDEFQIKSQDVMANIVDMIGFVLE